MTSRTLNAFNEFFAIFGSAIAVSSAVENGRKPRARDLRTLGINTEAFDRIRR
ncbi:hypothetical protein [Mesorhizobium sp. NBSH29]|uniref:hypothetical protein n=1 Tax=Mesorhizobium sp. NBSH29 TaxID=2654249 RepID=UPI0018968E06|nr:hypothetical protein [Mesorhizobium sp. NBSH29]